jgi:hypothetical protein
LTDKIHWWLSTACAFLLLFAPFTPRTIWLPTGRSSGGGQITEGVGWHAIAALFGVAALVVLVLSLRDRQRGPSQWVGVAVATIAFIVVAIGMWRHWTDLMNGVTSVDPGAAWVLHPAPVVLPFALVAAVGAGFAGALTIRLRWREVSGSG